MRMRSECLYLWALVYQFVKRKEWYNMHMKLKAEIRCGKGLILKETANEEDRKRV